MTKINKKGSFLSILGGFFTFVVIVGILLLISGAIRIPIEDNSGTQVGYLTTLDQNGIIFKTHSIYIKSNLESSQEERYCVDNNEILEDIEDAIENGKKVKLFYNDYISRGWSHCKVEDLDIVYKIEVLN